MMKKSDLSKVQISKPEEKSRTTMETVRCSICNEVSSKSVLRVCNSGHWARHTFQPDSAPPYEGLVQCCSIPRCEVRSLCNKDFAGGDHHHCSKCFRQILESKRLNNVDVDEKAGRSRHSIPEDEGINKKTTKTTIKYKNFNFRTSDSLLSIQGSNEHETMKNGIKKSTDIMLRPITCPISNCRKMIARASILQHFIFDHSKVPRITFSVDEPQRVYINVSAVNNAVRCYAVFLVKIDSENPRSKKMLIPAQASCPVAMDVATHPKRRETLVSAPLVHTVSNTLMNGGHKNASFLLMGVRMQSAEIIKKTHEGKCVSLRHAQTQTEAPAKSSKVCLEPKAAKDSIVADGADGYFADHRDVILLWICKLVQDITFYYTISIRRSDRKLGYSFTGETLNIGDFQDLPMHGQVECLRILETAAMKLMNEQNELEVVVNIFK